MLIAYVCVCVWGGGGGGGGDTIWSNIDVCVWTYKIREGNFISN